LQDEHDSLCRTEAQWVLQLNLNAMQASVFVLVSEFGL